MKQKNAPTDVSVKQTRKLFYETFRISVHFGLEVQEFDGFKGYFMTCFSQNAQTLLISLTHKFINLYQNEEETTVVCFDVPS